MKRVGNLYNKITSLQTIMDVYKTQVKLNTKNKYKIEKFEHYLMLNLVKIQEMIIGETVNFDKYHIFLINDPKYRIIMSQSISDKIINHLVAKYFLLGVFEKSLIDNNVATRKGKGTHYGIRMLKKYINELKKVDKPIYYLKCDIKKFFYNIDHGKLKQIIRSKIKDERALSLIDKIIDTADKEYIREEIEMLCNSEIEKLESMNMCEKDKKRKINELRKIINTRNIEKGIPIGNMTSQAFAVIYLNEFDHFIKETLRVKYYLRYMDDLIIIDNDKNRLKEILNIINLKLKNEFFLELNDKTKIGMLKNGLECLGFRFILDNNKLYLKLRNNTKKRFKRKAKKMSILVAKNKLNIKKYKQVMASYKGHLQAGNTYNLYYRVVNRNTKKVILNCIMYTIINK